MYNCRENSILIDQMGFATPPLPTLPFSTTPYANAGGYKTHAQNKTTRHHHCTFYKHHYLYKTVQTTQYTFITA